MFLQKIIAKFLAKRQTAKLIRGLKADYSPSLYEVKSGIIYKKGFFEKEPVDRIRRS